MEKVMIKVKIEDNKYNIDIDTPCNLGDLCIKLLKQGVDLHQLCSYAYLKNDDVFLDYNYTIENDNHIIVFMAAENADEYYNSHGKDNIGKWFCVFRKKIKYFENFYTKENDFDFWKNEFNKSQEFMPFEYQKDINKRFKNTYVQINFYPRHLFFSVMVIGDKLGNYSYSSTCKSLDEAYDVSDGIIKKLTSILLEHNNIDLSNIVTHTGEISVWAKNRSNWNFSQIFLINKQGQNIDFYIWNSAIKKREKSTLKFNAFSDIFKNSPDFSIKASIFGKKMYVYDLLQLGDEDLSDIPFNQRINFLNMLVDNWEKNNYKVVVEGFQNIY
jgi:hypothetical protein